MVRVCRNLVKLQNNMGREGKCAKTLKTFYTCRLLATADQSWHAKPRDKPRGRHYARTLCSNLRKTVTAGVHAHLKAGACVLRVTRTLAFAKSTSRSQNSYRAQVLKNRAWGEHASIYTGNPYFSACLPRKGMIVSYLLYRRLFRIFGCRSRAPFAFLTVLVRNRRRLHFCKR